MTRPTTTGKAQDLITFTRSTTGTALAKISYGEELVTNGTEWTGASGTTPPTGWTSSGIRPNYAVVDGTLSVNPTSNIWTGYAITGLVIGKSYQITGEYKSGGAGGSVYLRIANSVGANAGDSYFAGDTSSTDWTTEQGTFTPTATTVYVSIGVSQNKFGYFDNISVKEVLYDQPDGTLQLFNHPINKPRIEYDASGNCLGLLVEEARTNFVTYSEDFTQSSWVKLGAGIASTAVVTSGFESPAGTNKATRLQCNLNGGSSSGDQSLIYSGLSGTGNHSISFWVKSNTGLNQTFVFGNALNNDENGVATDKWQRFTHSNNFPVNRNIFIGARGTTGSDDTLDILIYGAQLEAGSFPTSYIPTSGSAITRAADVASLAVSEFGYNQDQGTVSIGINNNRGVAGALGDGTFNNDLRFGVVNSNIGRGVGSGFAKSVTTGGFSGQSKIAIGIQEDNYSSAGDGAGAGVNDTSASLPPNPVNIYIGKDYGNYLNGHIKSIQYYPLRLSNAQLQALTV